jgi:transcription elongation factor GreA-like protein
MMACAANFAGTAGRILQETIMLYFALGDFVHHPAKPEWGIGQVQSIVGMNVTVNFAHAGKQMINCAVVELVKATAADINQVAT